MFLKALLIVCCMISAALTNLEMAVVMQSGLCSVQQASDGGN